MKNSVYPHGLQVLADAAGTDAALKIALARGGSRLRIPQKAEGSILEELVGIDAARLIVNDLADERFEIPLAKKLVFAWLREQGQSVEKAGSAIKVSRRTAQYWDSGTTPTREPDLFSTQD